MSGWECMDPQEIQTAPTHPVAPAQVSGWLEVLCFILTIVYPASVFYEIFRHIVPNLLGAHNTARTLLLIVYSVVFIAVAVFSCIAGLKLWVIKRDAVGFARRFLWTYLLMHFAYFAFWILIARPSQSIMLAEMGYYHIVGPIGSFALWYFYLEHSKRVRLTYSSEVP